MWHQILDSGKCRYFERYKDAQGTTHTASVTYDKHSRQNEKYAFEALQNIISEKSVLAVGRLSFDELCDLYLKNQALTVKASTCYTATCDIRALRKIIGNVQADKVTAGYFKTKLLESGLTANRQNVLIRRFKCLYRWAYTVDLVKDIQFLEKITRNRDGKPKYSPEDKYLEGEEVRLIRENLKPKWRDVFDLLVLTGMRYGEMASLHVRDVDLDRRLIDINSTYYELTHEETAPKTSASNRQIYIQDQLFPLMERLTKDRNKDDLLFGRRIPSTSLKQALQKASRGVTEKNVSPHTLRHTHCSLLAENFVPLEAISARLGHGNSETTREIYLHVTQKMKDRENERLKNIRLF